MNHGAITSYVDWAQIALYLFWIFFAGLVYYLQRESKREGFPLQHNMPGGRSGTSPGLVGMPTPKTFVSLDGSTHTAPNNHQSPQKLNARPMNRFNGAPLDPVGNPLLAGVGPGSWADRADKPEMTPHGDLVLAPLRAAKGISVSKNDVNPIGLNVLGADNLVAGVVKEMWVDQSEMIFRHIEVEVKSGSNTRRVLVPMTFARVHRGLVKVEALLASQFEQIPGLKNPDQITMLEEEKITAYFGAGTLYATPNRQDPLF
jgi:photosynthetic reaction center H subunit